MVNGVAHQGYQIPEQEQQFPQMQKYMFRSLNVLIVRQFSLNWLVEHRTLQPP